VGFWHFGFCIRRWYSQRGILFRRQTTGEMVMTEDYDFNGNGKIDPDEREIMLEDRRRAMEDADAKRDAQRQMTWFALSGMVLYPLAILGASVAGLSTAAELIADIANIYVVSVSALVGAYFGFSNMGAKK